MRQASPALAVFIERMVLGMIFSPVRFTLKDGRSAILRSPDPKADIGEHDFTYAYYVWNGSFINSQVVQKGYELNVPVTECSGYADDVSMLNIDQNNVVVEAVKAAEDGSGDVILRLYEAYHGKDTEKK